MKCENCGANLRIEDAFCPYCGAPNPDAIHHRQDMQEYQQKFQRTQRDVYRSAKKFSLINIRIIIVLVLVVLLLVTVMLNSSHYEISRWIRHTRTAAQSEEHRAKLTELEAEGKYQAFYEYYSSNDMYYFDEVKDFSIVYYVSSCYASAIDSLERLIARDQVSYINVEGEIQSLCDSVGYLYGRTVRGTYDGEEEWSPQHTAAIEDMKAEINLMLITYCNLKEEDLEVFEAAKSSRKQIMIEEGMGLHEE